MIKSKTLDFDPKSHAINFLMNIIVISQFLGLKSYLNPKKIESIRYNINFRFLVPVALNPCHFYA